MERDEDKFRREIGSRLRLTRKALFALDAAPRWQKEFAASIGLVESTYNQIESCKQILTPPQAVRIYERYGISLNWLYAGSIHELPWMLVSAIEAERQKPPE